MIVLKYRLQAFCMTLLLLLLCTLQVSAAPAELHWYCVRNKANRQAIAAPELRFVEELGGYYIDHKHGDGDADKVVYLTFDAGYENGNVEKILNTLKSTDTPAAFFVLEHLITANPDLVRRMGEEGHLVCNHTAHHPNLACAASAKIEQEIRALEETYRTVIGGELSKYFRPPEGSFSREMLTAVQALGYKTVFWSFAYADWDNAHQPNPETAIRTIMTNMHNGAVLLLHPTSATNAEILPRVIALLRAEGYRFGTLDELCGV